MYTAVRQVQESVPSLNPACRARHPSRVLIVDDDPAMLGQLEDMLRGLGVPGITKAAGGMAALAALEAMSEPPELVICDLNLPGDGGFQCVEALGAHGFKGPVVLMSDMDLRTMHSATLAARGHHLKVAGSLGKPISAWALAAVLANLG